MTNGPEMSKHWSEEVAVSFHNGGERNDKSSDAKMQKQPMKINRNGRKVEVKTESLSATTEKEMTSPSNSNML